jgi:hypothetical protein
MEGVMRVVLIYRPRNAAPPELVPQLFQQMRDWVTRYESRTETIGFFVTGGGFAVLDSEDAAELQRITAENPFTPFADVEVHPVVDPETALRTFQELFQASTQQ